MEKIDLRALGPTYLDVLRDFLRDVPRDLPHAESVQALGEAFGEFSARNPAEWVSRDVEAFHAESTLQSVLGRAYTVELGRRYFWLRGRAPAKEGSDTFMNVPSNIRDRVDRFAVVGTTRERLDDNLEHPRLKAVFLRGGLNCGLDSPARLPATATGTLELFRARQGLMNRRQALLLADHLNRFGRYASDSEGLEWRAVRGPEIDGSARAWLDSIGGTGLYLRGLVGANDDWGLGQQVVNCLNHYECLPVPAWCSEQVFAYQRSRVVLPPRYEVYFKACQAGNGASHVGQLMLLRKDESQEARTLAEMCFQAWPYTADTGDLELARVFGSTWFSGPESDWVAADVRGLIACTSHGHRYDYDYRKSLEKSVLRYSHALERDEAIRVAEQLKRTTAYEDIGIRLAPRRLKVQQFSLKRCEQEPPLELEFDGLMPFETRLLEKIALSAEYVAVDDFNVADELHWDIPQPNPDVE